MTVLPGNGKSGRVYNPTAAARHLPLHRGGAEEEATAHRLPLHRGGVEEEADCTPPPLAQGRLSGRAIQIHSLLTGPSR